MTGNKIFGIKEQVAAEKIIKDAGLMDAAENLYLYLSRKQNYLADYLFDLKIKNQSNDFQRFFSGNRSWEELWYSPSFSEVVKPMIKYWYKKKFKTGYPPLGYLTQSEMPTGLITFGSGDYNKRDTSKVTDIEKFREEVVGDFKYNPDKTQKFYFFDDGAWFISKGVTSYIPYSAFPKLKSELKDFIGHEVEFQELKYTKKAVPLKKEEVEPFEQIFANKNENDKLEELDVKLLLNGFYIPAEASAYCDVEYPIFHELRIKGVDYPVPSLAFFQGINSLQESDALTAYYSPKHIILSSTNGAFSIIDVSATGLTYSKVILGAFKKGMTIRETERLEVTPRPILEIPQDLLERRPIIQSIIDKQRLLTDNYYDNILSLIADYILSYTKKITIVEKDKILKKEVIKEIVDVPISPENESNLNYVYEVEEIYWKYNEDILVEELLAYFVLKGDNKFYQLLCLKVLGIDYMYHYTELVDALIHQRLLMIEDIKVDTSTRQLLELKYNYLYLYASGNTYEKFAKLVPDQSVYGSMQNHIVNYYGDEIGTRIIDSQVDILKSAMPETCVAIPNDQRRQLNLDLSNSIFWESDFPELKLKGGERGTILQLFLTYLHKPSVTVEGEVTKGMVENGYMLPITRTEFIGGYDNKGKPYGYVLPNWKYNNKLIKFPSASMTDVLITLFPQLQKYRPLFKTIKDPVTKRRKRVPDLDSNGKQKQEKVKMKVKDFMDFNAKPPLDEDWRIKEARELKKAIEAKYFDMISEIKEEGNRIFNQLIQNELTAAGQDIIADRWNKKFNTYKDPVSNKIPVFLKLARYFGTDVSKKFALNKIQLEGIKFIVSRGNNALLAHEVGLGKTLLAIGAISHLFETGDLSRILVLTPKAVHPKFMKEARGDMNEGFRGAIPHINLVDLDNAKPNKFLPDYNKQTKQITLDRLKKYTPSDMVLHEQYKVFLAELEETKKYLTDKKFEPDQANVDLIKDILIKNIPNWQDYEFLALMMMDVQQSMYSIQKEISDSITRLRDKYLKEKQQIPDWEKEKVKGYYKKIFSNEILGRSGNGLIDSVENKILDELGTYLPEVMKPQTIIMATHIALTELLPDEQSLENSAMLSDDAENMSEARTTTKRLVTDVKKQAITFGKLKIDGIIVDEVHNFNELVSGVRSRYVQERGEQGKKYYRYGKIKSGGQDSIGLNSFKYWYKIGNANKTKMTMLALTQQVKSRILLSATPFTEGPLHAFSVMNMVNRQKLIDIGYGSSYTFFENFIIEKWKLEPKIETNQVGLAATVDRYRNMSGLCNFMRAFTDFKVGGEELDAKRPQKFIIPDYSQENEQNEEGRQVSNVSSYVPNTPQQEILKQRISDFVSGKIEKDQVCKEPIVSTVPVKVPISQIEDEDEKDEGEETGKIDVGGGTVYIENAGKTFKREARMFQAKSMQEKMNISPYFLECSPSEIALPELKGNIVDANGNEVVVRGHTLTNAAKNFVENSPKLYYTVGCIASVLTQHLIDGLDKSEWSGQIIYLNLGKKFIFDGEPYNAYDLIKEYLVYHLPMGIELEEDEVSMIYGGKQLDKSVEEDDDSGMSPMQRTINDFNSGKIKVLIGSSKIREGIDLQKNSSVIYILQAEYNPTNAIQLEGRIWRQGNRWANVRVVYVLAYNSIDKFIYSKVKMKIASIKGVMSAGDCDLNKTNIFSLDPAEVQSNLTTDPDDNAKLWWQTEEASMRKKMAIYNTQRQQLIKVKNEYEKVKENLDVFLKQLNEMSKVLESVKLKGLKEKIIHELRAIERQTTESSKIKPVVETGKEADELIASGKYTLPTKEIHRDFTVTMAYADFQMRLDYVRTNYSKALDLRGNKKKEALEQMKLDLDVDNQQQIYWKTLIKVGFNDYNDYYTTLEKFTRNGAYDEILSSYTSLVTSYVPEDKKIKSKPKTAADIPDLIEEKDNLIKAIKKRLSDSKGEIETEKNNFIELMEAMKVAGAFDIQTQIDAFASTNYLLKLRTP